MKLMTFTIALLALATLGCKAQYWVFADNPEGETVAVVDTRANQPAPTETPDPETPDPEPDAEPPKDLIFILGINGMD